MRRFSHALTIAVGLCLAGRGVVAQAVPHADDAAEVRKQFLADLDTLHVKFVALANAIPADKYTWRPAPGVRSVGEAFQHVAAEFYVWGPMAYGAPRSAVIQQGREGMQKWESLNTKEEVLKNLDDGFAYIKQQISGIDVSKLSGTQKLFGGDRTIIETSFIMTDDLHEHLGQLIAYARMNGVKPPWSR
ncbi:MAG TPA: DinB family protein [Gemmatimonadaceae bacterium]|nr:DinB family protein [Gemmatimonadaceae bacterium]